jgi:hypothetical protein
LRIPKIERLMAEELQRFRRLRDARQALLRKAANRIVQSAEGS